MRLPLGRGHDLLKAGAVCAADQYQHHSLLAAVAHRGVATLSVAPLVVLAFFGATRAACCAGVGVRAWMAFRIRATDVLRSVNFL
jgi:hypothetical protein